MKQLSNVESVEALSGSSLSTLSLQDRCTFLKEGEISYDTLFCAGCDNILQGPSISQFKVS
jgi:hypothetical protein